MSNLHYPVNWLLAFRFSRKRVICVINKPEITMAIPNNLPLSITSFKIKYELMAVITGIRFVNMEVRAMPRALTPEVKNIKARVDEKTASANKEAMAWAEGLTLMKCEKSKIKNKGINKRAPKRF